MEASLDNQARDTVRQLVLQRDALNDFGSMSCAVYDTAWVSRIRKNNAWLFPQCFSYVLHHQEMDGAWGLGASEVDGILSTASSLLALHDHMRVLHEDHLSTRLDTGKKALQEMLSKWNVASTDHVGFELLVPALLLELEAFGTSFEFPGRDTLMKIREAKLARFQPEMLYDSTKTTALHSLEAFIGQVDFDRVGHHKSFGSLMASPSSTAAYLMHSSVWDNEVENYLCRVLGRGGGGVPSAYPSTYFEYSWTLSVLLKAGFTDLSQMDETTQVQSLLTKALSQHGVIGFAPLMSADADDTSRAIFTLSLLGAPVDPTGMFREFEKENHFVTYDGERTASFSANCNILLALLHLPNPAKHSWQISKASQYLYQRWCDSNDRVMDKWNNSPLYPNMLLAQCFAKLIELWDDGSLPELDAKFIKTQVPLVLFQVLSRTLQTQNANGRWGSGGSGGTFEETAYAILAIAAITPLSFSQFLREEIEHAIGTGQKALSSFEQTSHSAEYLWVEKVSYGSDVISKAYVLAALKSAHSLKVPESVDQIHGSIDTAKVDKFIPFYQRLQTIGALPNWRIKISLMEGCLFAPLLQDARFEVFPPRSLDGKEETYWDNIRFTWCCANSLDLTFAPISFIVDWMKISYINYQADEYMEAIVGPRFLHKWKAVEQMIEQVWKPVETSANGQPVSNGTKLPESNLAADGDDERDFQEILRVFTLLRDWTFTNPRVINASPYHLEQTRHEMKMWILGHLIQAVDCDKLAQQDETRVLHNPPSSFYHWATHVSADHTSCPYAYELALCYISESTDVFPTAEGKYYSAACNRHLSTLCRLENDYGSVPRDLRENNLNAVHFPEFHGPTMSNDDAAQKAQLLRIADYERHKYKDALRRLDLLVTDNPRAKRKMQLLRVMTNVTDSWGQMYVVRDLARTIEHITQANSQQLVGNWTVRRSVH